MPKEFANFFTNPPRQSYYEHDLGPQIFTIEEETSRKSITVKRNDFECLNNRKEKLKCSLFQRTSSESEKCIVYLHTHHGSRIESLFLVKPIMSQMDDVNVCVFDFGGYGNSSANGVTLGIKESEEIGCVLEKLRKEFRQSSFVLWGRSMGAVAGLLYLANNQNKVSTHNVIAGVFDSPFYSIYQLSLELGSKTLGIPQPIVRPFVYILKKSLEKEINFDDLELLPLVHRIKIPSIFLASKLDRFINCKHSEMIYEKYGGVKELLYIEEDHNEPRNKEELEKVFRFVFEQFSMLNKNSLKSQNYFSLNLKRNFSCSKEKQFTAKYKKISIVDDAKIEECRTERKHYRKHSKKMSIISLNSSPSSEFKKNFDQKFCKIKVFAN